MDIEGRDAYWKEFLEIKSNLAQAFKGNKACKICMCLELLKIATCPGGCGDWEEVFETVLEGVLDSSTIQTLRSHFSDHAGHIQFGYAASSELKSLSALLSSYNSELRSYGDIENLMKNSENNPPLSAEAMKRVEVLENRITTYEESLSLLRKENDDLRTQLLNARVLYDDYNKSAQNAQETFNTQIGQVKDDQHRLRGSIETIAKQVADNAGSIENIKKELEGGRIEMDTTIREMKRVKTEWLKEQESINNRIQFEVEKLSKGQAETDGKIRDSVDLLEKLKTDYNQLLKWQNECREVSRHSGHLLSAADSVFSAHQQYLESQQIISEHLERIKRELEYLSKQ